MASDQEEAKGVISYLHEYMKAHLGIDAPDFSITNLELTEEVREENPCKTLQAHVRLAPYEVGVRQDFSFYMVGMEPTRWQCRVVLERKAGPRIRWIRLNHHYVDLLRKQPLLWKMVNLLFRESM